MLTWWHVAAAISCPTPTQGFFPPSVVPIQKSWSQDDWQWISGWRTYPISFLPSLTVIGPCTDFLLRPPEGSTISYPHYCFHCQNGMSLFPIPFNLDANATRGISEYPPFCRLSVRPIRGIDCRTGIWMPEWRAYHLGFFSIAHCDFSSGPITKELTEI